MASIKTSNFQFSNPKVTKMIFEVNDKFVSEKYKGTPLSYEVISKNIDNNSADVELNMKIGVKGTETPFYIELAISSRFIWTEDAAPVAEDLLKKNAVMMLISYARPLVAHLTVDAGYQPFNIPFVDLRDDFKKMNQE